MPIWEITDCNGNSHSVDLSKTSIKTIDDVKAEFKKFDEKRKLTKEVKTNVCLFMFGRYS